MIAASFAEGIGRPDQERCGRPKERPYYGTPAWDGPLGKWIGSARAVPVGDEEIPHHGDTLFYDAFRVKGKDERRVWLEYRARFTEGSLTNIKVAEVRDLPPTKTIELGGGAFEATESDLGIDVVRLGDETEVEREN
jgi:hypothetical protein